MRISRLPLVGAIGVAAQLLIGWHPSAAADIATRGPVVKAPIAVPAFTWTGFYWGGSIGYDQHRTKWTDADGWYFGDVRNISSSGAIFGVNAGYNVQHGSLVYGVESDISYSTAKKDYLYTGEPVIIDVKARWIGTARVRLGYAADRTLFYATGGLAFSNSRAFWNEASGAQWDWPGWNIGYAIGGGIEHAFSNPHWTIRLEALLLQFKQYTADHATTFDAICACSTLPFDMLVKNRDLIVRLGINYKY